MKEAEGNTTTTGSTSTSEAVSWSPICIAFARRTLHPPRHPRWAGRQERAPVISRPPGVLTLAGRRPPSRRHPCPVGPFTMVTGWGNRPGGFPPRRHRAIRIGKEIVPQCAPLIWCASVNIFQQEFCLKNYLPQELSTARTISLKERKTFAAPQTRTRMRGSVWGSLYWRGLLRCFINTVLPSFFDQWHYPAQPAPLAYMRWPIRIAGTAGFRAGHAHCPYMDMPRP